MNATESAIKVPEGMNIAGTINKALINGALDIWTSTPMAKWPAWIWKAVLFLIVFYILYWFYNNFIR